MGATNSEIFADENLISMVLINLMKNALEANVENSSCIIKVWAETAKDNLMQICVSDNGPGISEENLDKIFIPFFTTRSERIGNRTESLTADDGSSWGYPECKVCPLRTETVFSLRIPEMIR
jgi:K+-sensing histidine kinase KdpD